MEPLSGCEKSTSLQSRGDDSVVFDAKERIELSTSKSKDLSALETENGISTQISSFLSSGDIDGIAGATSSSKYG
ncbi:unnamed protein product [Chondrus crispus]|uniref:Uncharacterized protein n=1 Tax=Chondrus crispus TaxID=2769 RepID=R7QBI6_CHOCR|nr:unnamed protein product [Chondrus crispus]CDF35138.1 unnamed protein product [Chondrus crispus]|eukprot:XP_005714957.1 unnamed protein product [Chondrus crispus]